MNHNDLTGFTRDEVAELWLAMHYRCAELQRQRIEATDPTVREIANRQWEHCIPLFAKVEAMIK